MPRRKRYTVLARETRLYDTLVEMLSENSVQSGSTSASALSPTTSTIKRHIVRIWTSTNQSTNHVSRVEEFPHIRMFLNHVQTYQSNYYIRP